MIQKNNKTRQLALKIGPVVNENFLHSTKIKSKATQYTRQFFNVGCLYSCNLGCKEPNPRFCGLNPQVRENLNNFDPFRYMQHKLTISLVCFKFFAARCHHCFLASLDKVFSMKHLYSLNFDLSR